MTVLDDDMKTTRTWQRIFRYLKIIGFLIISVGSPHLAFGEPVTTIRNNGDSANRVDLVILGDGYTSSELTKFASDVENAVVGLFDQEPFKEYKNYFNVHRIDGK
jgi:hypothetical protein